MDSIMESINTWITEFLIEGILSHVESMFESVNEQVSDIAAQVGTTPSGWNSEIFSLIQNISDAVIVPIAGMILTFVMCWELIQMIIDKNNMNDFPPSDIFKWMMKTFIAVLIVTNTFTIIMGIFDVAQSVATSAADTISTEVSISVDDLTTFEEYLYELGIGTLLGVYMQTYLLNFCMKVLSICVFLIIYGRMIEIYLMTSLGAIPLATITSKEWNLGNNYIKAIFALAFQAFLIVVCVGIYAVLVQNLVVSEEPLKTIWQCVGYTVLLCFSLFKTGTLSKSIFTAH